MLCDAGSEKKIKIVNKKDGRFVLMRKGLMRKTGFTMVMVIGLILTLGLTSVLADGDNKKGRKDDTKRPKNSGALKVTTSPMVMTVKVDGKVLGMSGLKNSSDVPIYYLSPGFHNLEVIGPDGKVFAKEIEIRKNATSCICIDRIEKTNTEACPYNVSLDGPEKVLEGDLITFASFNAVDDTPEPLKYVWTVKPDTVKITSGLGTSAITVDTTGIGGQTITAELDVSNGYYDEVCRQKIPVSTLVEELPKNEAVKFDEFESMAFNDDKARLDSLAIQLQNNPDSQAYIIMYQGTDRNSLRNRNVEKLSQRTLDYLVNTRGIDARRVVIANWGTRPKTTYEFWLIPPGASPPVPK